MTGLDDVPSVGVPSVVVSPATVDVPPFGVVPPDVFPDVFPDAAAFWLVLVFEGLVLGESGVPSEFVGCVVVVTTGG